MRSWSNRRTASAFPELWMPSRKRFRLPEMRTRLRRRRGRSMLMLLTELSDQFSALNVFRSITFRTGGALITSAIIVFLFGPTIISVLRIRQGKGQPIRADGPQTHFKKAGTPTMGGLMILCGIL